VIKTGRQIVEKKQINFPERFSKQLDAIKQQYNRLGAQVSSVIINKDLLTPGTIGLPHAMFCQGILQKFTTKTHCVKKIQME
jgi:hypothetical protein